MSMNVIEAIEAEQLRTDIPAFRPGDTVKVHVKVVEGEKERIQIFEGVVLRRSNGANRETFTVRKVSYGMGVERTFPVHSPRIDKVEVATRGRVRRAKLYYLRGLSGKAGVGFGHFPFPQLLFCRLNSAHHRRQPRSVFVDAHAKINLGAARVFAKLRHQDQDFVLRLRGKSF